MHPRRTIRKAIADHIRTGGTAAESRVWDSRDPPVKVEPVLMEQGPIILVYTRSDTIKDEDYPVSGFDGAVRRTLEVAVEITAVGNDMVDDKLDDLAEQVEALLEDFEVTDLPMTEIRLKSSEIVTSDEFEMPLGGALLLYDAVYWKEYRRDTEDEWFPENVNVIPNGGEPEHVADCDDCADGKCP